MVLFCTFAKINSAKSSRFCQSQKLIPLKCIPEDLQIAKINAAKINYFSISKNDFSIQYIFDPN